MRRLHVVVHDSGQVTAQNYDKAGFGASIESALCALLRNEGNEPPREWVTKAAEVIDSLMGEDKAAPNHIHTGIVSS